jgi:hypothetical protein
MTELVALAAIVAVVAIVALVRCSPFRAKVRGDGLEVETEPPPAPPRKGRRR